MLRQLAILSSFVVIATFVADAADLVPGIRSV